MTADKAFERRVRKAAREISEAITALPATWTPADVVAIWEGCKMNRWVLEYAYTRLDTHYKDFPDYEIWHARLRATRNDPEHGPAMFAAIRKENHELY